MHDIILLENVALGVKCSTCIAQSERRLADFLTKYLRPD